MAKRSKASVCGRSPAGIAGSNPAGLRILDSSAVCFAWESVHVPASFKTAVDCTTGGPVGLCFSDGLL